MNPYDSDSDDDAQDNVGGGVPTQQVYDPERNERIRQMVQASSQQNVLADDQVTDFVLRMAEKNQNMMNRVQEQAQQQQQQFTISDDDSDDEEIDRRELDTSFKSRQRQRQREQQYQQRSPEDYPPGEAYAGDEMMDEDDQIPSFDPKDDDAISYGRLCCVACALVIAMVATSVLILVFVIIADGEEGGKQQQHHGGFDGMVLPFAPSNLPDLCSTSALKTFQGVLDCREPCMKAACCWEKGENGQQPVCWESHPLECAPYESCVNLLSAGNDNTPQNVRPTSNIPTAPDGVKSCDPKNINSVDEVLLCEDSCSYGACCWKTDDNKGVDSCPTDPNCPSYKACEILNSGAGSTGEAVNPATQVPDGGIQPAPANLKEICATQSADDTSCQDICNVAPCCWKLATITYTGPLGNTVTESVMGSCSHESGCVGYAPCRSLPTALDPSASKDQIPQVSNLEAACNQSLEGVCKETCNAAPCCWQIATSTFTNGAGQQVTEAVQGSCSHRDECEGYAPCLKLVEADTTTVTTTAPASVPQPTDLEQACATSLDGTCRETCHKATCCWKLATTTYTGPQGNTITESVMGSCSHLDECDAYEPCKQLSEATASHTQDIPPAPADLPATCAARLDGNCRDTCQKASCCWQLATTKYTGPLGAAVTEHVKGSCNHRAECVGYEACQALPEADSRETPPPLYIPTAPANLDQVCHPAPEEMDAIEACVEYCDAAMCCWKMSTTTFTNPQGQSVTESIQGSCSHQPECDAYKSCSVLDDDVFSPHTPAVDPTAAPVATPVPATPVPATAAPGTPAPVPATPGAPDPSKEYTEEVIFDVCYNHEQQGNGPDLCEQVCTPGQCCYKDELDCADAFDCAKYEPCTKLIEDADANSNQPSALETACNNKSDLAECVRLCAEGTCCFTTDITKTCDVAAPSTVCSEYTPCETIYNSVNGGGRHLRLGGEDQRD